MYVDSYSVIALYSRSKQCIRIRYFYRRGSKPQVVLQTHCMRVICNILFSLTIPVHTAGGNDVVQP